MTSASATGYEPGGPAAQLNFLEPHLETVFKFIGFTDISVVRVGSEEHQGEHFTLVLAEAEHSVDEIVDHVAREMMKTHRNDFAAR